MTMVNDFTARHAVEVHTTTNHAAHTIAPGTHWANIAVSVGGLATAGALLVSLLLLWQQMRNQRQAQRDRHLDHARNISFWITLASTDDGTNSVYGRGTPTVTANVHIVNASAQPAMSVLAMVGIRADIWRDASAKDDVQHEERGAEWNSVAIAPHDAKTFALSVEVPKSVAEIVADYKDPALIGELHFTDAAGIDWVRTHTGLLIERRSASWIDGIPLSLAKRDERRKNSSRHGDKKGRRASH